MTLYYSKETQGFYDDQINTTIPADSVEITQELHQELLSGQAEGKIIASGDDGVPYSKIPDRASLADYKETAKDAIDVLRKLEEEKGLSFTFPDGEDVIQLRNTRDMLNVQSLITVSQLLQAAGSNEVIYFQGESNVSHPMKPADLVAMGLAVAAYVQSLYAKSWAIKVALDAAADYDAVDALSVWPA